MVELVWTDTAAKWLQEIYEYNAQDSAIKARQVVHGICARAQVLTEYPGIGYLYRHEPDGDVKVLLYGHYRITYMQRTEHQIDILGVFHGALPLERYIKKHADQLES